MKNDCVIKEIKNEFQTRRDKTPAYKSPFFFILILYENVYYNYMKNKK